METTLFAIACDLRFAIRDRLRSSAIIWKPAFNCNHVKKGKRKRGDQIMTTIDRSVVVTVKFVVYCIVYRCMRINKGYIFTQRNLLSVISSSFDWFTGLCSLCDWLKGLLCFSLQNMWISETQRGPSRNVGWRCAARFSKPLPYV